MRHILTSISIGLALVAAVWFFGMAYPHLFGLKGERTITTTPTRFDRTQLGHDIVAAGFGLGDPAFLRIFKQERRLEVWMQHGGGRFGLFRSYAICAYSGTLGPKLEEGDRQAPEGFYRVARRQLNPQSRHHLAFNLGYPNQYDQQLGRTGSALMVHGGCSSAGCFAMGDAEVDELYALVEAALDAGQPAVDVAILPFVMDDAVAPSYAGHPLAPFWQNLKQGSDLFVRDGIPPKVGACNGQYRFGADAAAPGCAPITGWV